jgi:gliding motility-associated-like protein
VRLIVTNGGCADTITHTVNVVDERPDFTANRTVACKRGLINFSVTNTNFANIVNYAWDFGDGVTTNTTSPNIPHTYVNSGTYTVSLVTTDLNGCVNTRTKTNYIRINGPRASFSLTGIRGCVGLNTIVTDLSTTDGVNALTNWQFDFGDGTIQNFSAPPFSHVYNTPGTFNIKLILTDAAGCLDSVSRLNAVIVTDPTPDFFSRDTLSCPGATVRFTNTTVATPGFTSAWDFGDGNTSTLASPTNVYTATGSYNVTLTIRDIYGCEESITKNQYVRVELPQPAFTMSDTAGACTPLQIQFTNTSTYYTTSYWDFGVGQGTSTLTNPVHYYAVPGTYTIKLIVTSPGGCIDSTFRDVTVYDTSGSRITYQPVGGCSPLTVTLNTNTIGEMNSYFWDFGDGNTVSTTTPNVSHTYESFGNFLPKMIMEDPSGCLIPLEGTDTVFVTGANAKFGMDKQLFCDSAFVNFTDSSTFNDPIISYSWHFGDGATSGLQNPSHQYTSPGNYEVYMAVETVNGCRDTARITNAIKVVLSPSVDIAGDSIICINSPLLHSGVFLAVDTSLVTWTWNFPNGNTSTQQNPPIQTYTSAGNFIVTTVAMNSSGCTDSVSQTLVVNPLPTVTMPGQMTVQPGFPVVIPAEYSPNTASWVWSPAAGLSCIDCPTPLAGPQFNTFYQVYFTDSNRCSNVGSIEVLVVCKEGNLFIPNTFSPNGDGSNEIFYPRGKGLYNVRVLRIFNRWGEVVFEKRDFAANDPTAGWNGTYKGKKAQADVYVYQAEVICENGDLIKLNGNIALIL